MMAGLETTRCYRGTGVEHRSTVEARGKVPRVILGVKLAIFQDDGPLELTRRRKVLVWNDELESTHEIFKTEDEDRHESGDPFEGNEDCPSSLHASINTMPFSAPPTRLSSSGPRHRGPRRASLPGGRRISPISPHQYRSPRRI